MVGTENTLTEKLETNDTPRIKIDMNTRLGGLTKEMWDDYLESKEAGRTYSSGKRLAMCMLGYLNKTNTELIRVPRTIETVGELYSLSLREIRRGFPGYGKKTWRALNDYLKEYGLPPINLPAEYTC